MNSNSNDSKITRPYHVQQKNTYYGKPCFAVSLALFSILAGWFLAYDQADTGGKVIMNLFQNDFYIAVYRNSRRGLEKIVFI